MNIGQTVKVRRLRDQMPSSVISQIKENPVGVIKD
ncbi:MAG: cytochrome b6f subunit family protein, partial [Synechococcales cyanobacterium]